MSHAIFKNFQIKITLMFVLFLFIFISSGTVNEANAQRLLICNKGNQTLWVASLITGRGFLGSGWQLQGWWEIKPNSWCSDVGGSGYTHVVFAMENAKGDFGVVKYSFTKATNSSWHRKEICVKMDAMEEFGTSGSPGRYVPPCPKGYMSAPTSVTSYLQGNATYTLNIETKPSHANGFEKVLRHSKKSKNKVSKGKKNHSSPNANVNKSLLNGLITTKIGSLYSTTTKAKKILDRLPRNDRIKIVRRKSKKSVWYLIECQHGSRGWIHGNSIKILKKNEIRTSIQPKAKPASGNYKFNVGERYTTEFSVSKGQQITVNASGSIRVGMFAGNSTPNGVSGYTAYNYVRSIRHGALMVRIKKASNNGGWRYCGRSCNFKAESNGKLEFLVNDRDYSNNSGNYFVSVKL